MRQLQTLFLTLVLLLIGAFLFGCSKSDDADSKGTLGTTAPVNNSAPEAKSAPAAPSDPSIVYPGGKKKGGAH